MVLLSNIAYRLWVGREIIVPLQVSIGIAVYVCIYNWNSIFASFNNGASKMFMQVGLSLIAGISFIPLAALISRKTGLMGIPLSMGLSVIPGSFISPLQYHKLINQRAKGIWNR
jgi:hypothetical protein